MASNRPAKNKNTDEIVIDSGSIPPNQSSGKQTARFTTESTDEEIVVRISYPKIPEESKADPAAVRELFGWWITKAVESGVAVTVKALEYSSVDLHDMGVDLVYCQGRDPETYPPGQLSEIGIATYVIGKVSRWKGAIRDGRRVSTDTLMDIVTYCTMALRVRETGNWPGKPLDRRSDQPHSKD